MNLTEYFQIKTDGHNTTPLASQGPVLAASDDTLYLVYVGSGGSNVWWSYCNVEPNDFTGWHGNEQIKIQGKTPLETSQRPGLAIFNNLVVTFCVSPDQKDLICAYFDGNQWTSFSMGSTVFSGNSRFSQPAALVVDETLHLFVNLDDAFLAHATFSGLQLEAAKSWAWTIGGNDYVDFQSYSTITQGLPGTLEASALLCIHGVTSVVRTTLDPNSASNPNSWVGGQLEVLEPGNQSPLISKGAAMVGDTTSAVVGDVYHIIVVYVGVGGKTLYAARAKGWSSAGDPNNPPVLLQPSTPVQFLGKNASTGAPPAAIWFNGVVCIAHQGESSGNLYFGVGTI